MIMKKTTVSLLSIALSFFLSSCGDDHNHKGHEGGHHHEPPHGGVLVELGEHGTGFNLEVVHDSETGDLGVYVLGGHATNPVRIEAVNIDLSITAEGEQKDIALSAVANPAFEESVGDTSFFQAKAALPGADHFEGSVKTVTIKGRTFDNVSFSYPAKDDNHGH
ncbi:MAG: hypothetical protein CMI31_08575 [Opitutae bacterium]|nr:hypothetical protein [Opitutae bacterium]|tara:strand:- start:574 stop:1065 length:492 start_codon:yes stop_codon:yes gene_type:complete